MASLAHSRAPWKLGFLLAALALCFVVNAQGVRGSTPLPKAAAQGILDRYYKLLHGARTAYMLEEARQGPAWMKSENWLMRPRLHRSRSEGNNGKDGVEKTASFSSGDTNYVVDFEKKTYDIADGVKSGSYINGLEPFTEDSRPAFTRAGVVFGGSYGGKAAYVIPTGEQSIPGGMVYVYVDRKSLLPLGFEYWWRGRGEFHGYTLVRLNTPMSPSDFRWSPPPGFTLRMDLRTGAMMGPSHKD